MAYKATNFLDGLEYVQANSVNTRMKATVIVKVGINLTGDYPTLYSDYIPGVGNVFQFDKLIQDHYAFQVDLPVIRAVKPYKINQNVASAKLSIQSMTSNAEYNSGDIPIVGGGLSQFEKIYKAEFWDVVYPDSQRFCTWQPANKILNPGQIDFLYFYQNNDALTGKLRVRYTSTYTDNTTQSVVVQSDADLGLHEFWCIPVRESILAPSVKKLKRVLVEVINAGNAMLCSQLYHLYEKANEAPVQLFFKNSFNLWDTMTLYGNPEVFGEVSSYQYNQANVLGQKFNSGYSKISLNTGQMDVEWLQHLNELMFSSEIYLFGRGGFRRLIKLSTSYQWVKPSIDNNQTLEFRYAETDHFYSKIL